MHCAALVQRGQSGFNCRCELLRISRKNIFRTQSFFLHRGEIYFRAIFPRDRKFNFPPRVTIAGSDGRQKGNVYATRCSVRKRGIHLGRMRSCKRNLARRAAMTNGRPAWKTLVLAGAILAATGMAAAQEAQQPPVPREPPVAAAPPKPADNSGEAPQTRPPMKWKEFDYSCEAGTKLVVFLRGQSVKVRYQDNSYLMHQVPSGSGVRYSDGKVQWWSKGNGGFLQEDAADGNGAMIAKDCNLDRPLGSENNEGGNAEQSADRVTGTVTYLVRMSLPPTAVIDVVLLDVTGANDAVAGTLVAEKKLTLGDRQVPVEFQLGY